MGLSCRWFDSGTRAVFLDMTVYSPSANLYTSVAVLFEAAPSGQIEPQLQVESVRLYRYAWNWYHCFVSARHSDLAERVFLADVHYKNVSGLYWHLALGPNPEHFERRWALSNLFHPQVASTSKVNRLKEMWLELTMVSYLFKWLIFQVQYSDWLSSVDVRTYFHPDLSMSAPFCRGHHDAITEEVLQSVLEHSGLSLSHSGSHFHCRLPVSIWGELCLISYCPAGSWSVNRHFCLHLIWWYFIAPMK